MACASGSNDIDNCLTPEQVATLASANDRYTPPFELAHGVTQIGRFAALYGGDNSGIWLDVDGTGATTPYHLFVQGVVRNFWTGNPEMTVTDSDPNEHRKAIIAYSEQADDVLRYYVQPGYGHAGSVFMMNWDSLSALDTWVETGIAPSNPVARDGTKGHASDAAL